MKKFITLIALLILSFSCTKEIKETPLQQEEMTAKPLAAKNCNLVCNPAQSPDLQLVTNAEETRPLLPDGQVDSFSYFYTKYHVRTQPIRLTQNYVTPASYAVRYGWDSGQVVNRVTLQCLVENIADFGAAFDWSYTESQGYLGFGFTVFFDGLFEFETYEKGNGNNWKLLYTDYKKEFFPSVVPEIAYQNHDFEWNYERAIQAKTGDFYFNPFRFPAHDGVYKLVIKFNPSVKGCRAIKESNYNNNQKTILLEIKEGVVTII